MDNGVKKFIEIYSADEERWMSWDEFDEDYQNELYDGYLYELQYWNSIQSIQVLKLALNRGFRDKRIRN